MLYSLYKMLQEFTLQWSSSLTLSVQVCFVSYLRLTPLNNPIICQNINNVFFEYALASPTDRKWVVHSEDPLTGWNCVLSKWFRVHPSLTHSYTAVKTNTWIQKTSSLENLTDICETLNVLTADLWLPNCILIWLWLQVWIHVMASLTEPLVMAP